MLKFRLRPNRYVMAKNYVQVVSTNKEYRGYCFRLVN